MRPILAIVVLFLGVPLPAAAASIEVEVKDGKGRAIQNAVVYAVPEGRSLPLAKKSAVMDQRNRMFAPHVLPVQTGTAVHFPNSDDVRHHVYSFSPAKQFQIALYKGTPSNPEVFDKPGIVTLGCNIHDQMSAFIVVVDTPYFEETAGGRATLKDLPAGRFRVHVWYPALRQGGAPVRLALGAGDTANVSFMGGRGAHGNP